MTSISSYFDSNEHHRNEKDDGTVYIPAGKYFDEGDASQFVRDWSLKLNAFATQGKRFALMKVTQNENGHTDKIPWDIVLNKELSWSNKDNPSILTLPQALYILYQKRYTAEDENHYEVGMLIEKPWVFLDIDDIPDELDPISQRLKTIDKLMGHTYCEISQSGEGIHFIAKGKKIRDIKRHGDYEFYDSGRWVCLTGNIPQGFTNEVKELSVSQMEALEKFLWGDFRQKEKKPTMSFSAQNIRKDIPAIDDQELLSKIKRSKNGDFFTGLWENTDQHYLRPDGTVDASVGDFVLAKILAFWTGHDIQHMDSLFRQSKRMRDKWDRKATADQQTYGELTLIKAAEAVDDDYTGSNSNYSPAYSNKKEKEQKKSITFNSDKELKETLRKMGIAWRKQHAKKNGSQPKVPDNVIVDMIASIEPLRIIYASGSLKNEAPIYYYSWDHGYYKNDNLFFGKMFNAVEPSCLGRNKELDLIHGLKINARKEVPVVPDIRSMDNMTRRYLHVANGIYDLRTQRLLPASPEWAYTSYIETAYNENASKEPEYNGWKLTDYLKQVAHVEIDDSGKTKFDKKKYKLLWETIFAGIRGASYLRKGVIFVDDGEGSSGKSTLLALIRNVLGDDNYSGMELSEMADPQFVFSAENKCLIAGDEGDGELNESAISTLKKIISSDPVGIKKLYENPYHTIILAFVIQTANSLPKIKGSQPALIKRFVVIDFKKHFNNSDPKNWAVKHDYILRKDLHEWILYHCIHDVHLGISLTETEESHRLLAQNQSVSDVLNAFILYLESQELDSRMPTDFLYELYCAFYNVEKAENPMLTQPIIPRHSFVSKLRDNPAFDDKFEYVSSLRIPKWSNDNDSMKTLKDLNKKLPSERQRHFKMDDDEIKNYRKSGFISRKSNKI